MSERVIINQDGQQKAINREDFDLSLGKLDKGYTIAELRNISSKVLLATQHFLCIEEGKRGIWNVDEFDTNSLDDTGSCIVSVDAIRIKRAIRDKVFYSWFEDGTNDTSVFERALIISKNIKLPLFLNPYTTIIINKSFEVYSPIIGTKSVIKLIDNSTIQYQKGILEIKADDVYCDGLIIDGNNNNNRGLYNMGVRGIVANQVKRLELNNIQVNNTRDIGVLIANCPHFKFKNSSVDNCGRYGAEMSTAQADRIGVLLDNYFTSDSEYYMRTETVIQDVEITNCGLDGLVIGVGGTYKRIKANFNGLEFSQHNDGAAGIYVRPPQQVVNGIIDGIRIVECETHSNTGLGIDLGNNAGSLYNPKVTNFLINDNVCYQNGLHGLGVASAENGIIRANICYDNGTRALNVEGTTNNRRAGIGLACVSGFPFKNITVEGNVCYDSRSTGKTQQNGLWFDNTSRSSLSENLTVQNNNFTRNAGKAILFGDNSPVIASSSLSVTNNQGVNSYTFGVVVNNVKIPPLNPHMYLNAASALNIGSLELSTLNNEITLENVSPYDLTLVHGVTFKMLGQENLVLKPNKPVCFVQHFETGNFVWRQLPNRSSDVFYNGQISIQNQGVIVDVASSRFTVKSNTQGTKPYPEMTKANRLAIVLPAIGLRVYQLTATGIESEEGTWEYKSTGWTKVS